MQILDTIRKEPQRSFKINLRIVTQIFRLIIPLKSSFVKVGLVLMLVVTCNMKADIIRLPSKAEEMK
jgi:hypothetical protein